MQVRDRVAAYASRAPQDRAAVICTAPLRPLLSDLLARSGVRVDVFSYGELPTEMQLEPVDIVRSGTALAQAAREGAS